MNNKKIGTEFEKYVCKILKYMGYWVHFIAPDSRGAQPFDIIAVKNGMAVAIECKTLDAKQKYFSIDRIEENQRMAFERWIACGNLEPTIAVLHGDRISENNENIHLITWSELKVLGKVEM